MKIPPELASAIPCDKYKMEEHPPLNAIPKSEADLIDFKDDSDEIEVPHQTEENNKIEKSESKIVSSTIRKKQEKRNKNVIVIDPTIPPLNYSGKIPHVIWQQTFDIICLRISTLDDVNDYSLNVTNRSLELKYIIDYYYVSSFSNNNFR